MIAPIPRLGFLALAALVATPSLASAGGFATARFGGEHGHAASGHATALYYNPAGLSLGTGTRLHLEGLFALRQVTYERPEGAIDNAVDAVEGDPGTPLAAIDANAGTANLTNFIASPFAAVVTDFGVPNLGVGLGAYVPFGGSAEWDQNEAYEGDTTHPGAVDGVQRWANISGQQTALYITLAGSYRIPRANLSVGLGLNLIRNKIDTVRARNISGTDDLLTGSGNVLEGRSLLVVDSTDVSIGGGVIWEPTAGLHLGLSYQSQPGFGEQALEGSLTNKYGAIPTESPSSVRLTQELPDIARFAARYRTGPYEARFAADYQRWSVYENQCILNAEGADLNCVINADGSNGNPNSEIIVNLPRNYNDTFGLRAGGSYWATEELELNAGLGYDSNAVPDKTIDPSLFDMNKLIGNLGLVYSLPLERVLATLELTYTGVLFFDRTVAVRPRDSEGDSVTLVSPSRNPDHGGTYEQAAHILIFGTEVVF